jgi:hypothetical protein
MKTPEETAIAVDEATYEASAKINELWRIWAEQYPDYVDQTLYNLVITQIETTRTLIRLAAEVKE